MATELALKQWNVLWFFESFGIDRFKKITLVEMLLVIVKPGNAGFRSK